ncbi:unannotated protein [freshwater metagenome]|uniref:Unannotated protein n=1 Tax=freshwater metagenome TaxID=449393 RepID=A0A6J6IL14_9ZZZZ
MEGARAGGEAQAAAGRFGECPLVGVLPEMPGGGSRAVDLDVIGQSGPGDKGRHDAFGGGRTTDVSEADEGEADRFGRGHAGSLSRSQSHLRPE